MRTGCLLQWKPSPLLWSTFPNCHHHVWKRQKQRQRQRQRQRQKPLPLHCIVMRSFEDIWSNNLSCFFYLYTFCPFWTTYIWKYGGGSWVERLGQLFCKTASTPNINVRCFVAMQFLSQIYALFWRTIYGPINAMAYKKWQIWGMPYAIWLPMKCSFLIHLHLLYMVRIKKSNLFMILTSESLYVAFPRL